MLQVFWISPFAIHLHFHSSTVFNEKIHFLQHTVRNMLNSFSVFVFRHNCIFIMYERRRFVFITGIQNFPNFRFPRSLQKVEPTNAWLDFNCFCNNQRNFFIYIFNNLFNRRKHFEYFVSCIYHCTLLISVALFLFKEIQTCLDSNVMIWNGMLWTKIMSKRRTLCYR